MKRRIFAIICVLALTLSGCAEKTDTDTVITGSGADAETNDTDTITDDGDTSTDVEQLADGTDSETRFYAKKSWDTSFYNTKLYFYSFTAYDGRVYGSGEDFASVSIIYPEYEILYTEDDGRVIEMIASNQNGLWLLDHDEMQNRTQNFRIVHLSFEGDVVENIDFDGPEENYYFGMVVDSDDVVYLLRNVYDDGQFIETDIKVILPTGEQSEIKGDGDPIVNLVSSASGNAVVQTGQAEMYLRIAVYLTPDVSSISECETFDVPEGMTGGYTLDGICGGELCFSDETGLYSLNADGSLTTIIMWGENMISPSSLVLHVFEVDEGQFFCVDDDGSFLLTPGEAPDKTVITVAFFEEPTALNYYSCVSEFNSKSDEYYINIVNYCASASISNALKLCQTQMIAGSGPDIICFTSVISPRLFAASGWLEDLYEYIDDDPDISRDDLLLTDLMEDSGGLYALAADFAIRTYYTFDESLAGRNGLSYEEYKEIASELGEGEYMSDVSDPQTFLSTSLNSYIPDALNWDDGTCDFGSLAELLELSSQAPEYAAPSDLSSDERTQLIGQGKIKLNKVEYLSTPRDIKDIEEEYHGDATFIGWPTPDGECGSIAYFFERFGITAGSDCKEGAWEFIKYVLTSERATQVWPGLWAPILRESMEDEIDTLLNPGRQYEDSEIVQDEDGNFYIDGVLYEGAAEDPRNIEPLVTQEQVDKFYELLDSMTLIFTGEQDISKIVNSETESYFAGDKTAEETADIIQSRVSIFMAEQR